MELRNLQYFIAVAETGSLTEAAERRLLYTSQRSRAMDRAGVGIDFNADGYYRRSLGSPQALVVYDWRSAALHGSGAE